jgi:tetratricopeptide (TPR) repeat protein
MSTFNDIARYAEGEMNADERSAFETALSSNESLQQQLALYREVHTALQQQVSADAQRDQLQQTMQSLLGEFFHADAKRGKVISMKRYLLGAAAVAAILIAVIMMWPPDNAALYSRFSETSMPPGSERGVAADTTMTRAIEAFNKKEYAAAVVLLQQVKQQDSTDNFVNFYYGVALLQTGRLPEARAIFNRLYAGQSAFVFEAAWYQALGYLKEGNEALCREWLQKIPADVPEYKKAQELLKKL